MKERRYPKKNSRISFNIILLLCTAALTLCTCAGSQHGGAAVLSNKPAQPDKNALAAQHGHKPPVAAQPDMNAAPAQHGHKPPMAVADAAATRNKPAQPDKNTLAAQHGHKPPVAVYPWVGHSYPIMGIDYSLDGGRLVSAAMDGTAKIWDVETGRELWTLKGHNDALRAAVFSPDGMRAASASADKTVKVWDTRTGAELLTLAGHEGVVMDCAFSPDGEHLASCSLDGTIRIWDSFGGKIAPTRILGATGGDEVWEIAYSPDGKLLAAVSVDKTLRLWDTASGAERWVVRGEAVFSSLVFSPDGRRIAVSEGRAQRAGASRGRVVRVVDAGEGRTLLTLSGHEDEIYSVDFSADGKYLVSASGDRTVKVWDAASGALVRSRGGFSGDVIAARFSPEGRYIAAVDTALFAIYVWDWRGEGESALIRGFSAAVRHTVYSPDGQSIAASCDDGTVKVWDVRSGRELREFVGTRGERIHAVFSPDGALLAASSYDGTVRIWDFTSGALLRTIDGGAGYLFTLSFSPDGKRIACGSGWWSMFGFEPPTGYSAQNDVHIWDVGSGKKLLTLKGHGVRVNAVFFSPDGRLIVSGARDRSVKVWDAESGKELRSVEDISNSKIAITPAGNEIACADDDGAIIIIDTESGGRLREFATEGGALIEKIVYDRAGGRLAIASDDNTLRVLDAKSGVELLCIETGVTALAIDFAPGDVQIAAGFLDGSTRLYDARSGEEIVQCIGFNNGEWVTLSPKGFYNASPAGDEYINVRVSDRVDGIAQYRDIFYQPEMVMARVRGDDTAYRAAGILDAAAFMPPEVSIQSPASGSIFSSRNAELAITVNDSNHSITNITIVVNGRKLGQGELKFATSTESLMVSNAALTPTPPTQSVSFKLLIRLEEGENRIEVFASNRYTQGRGRSLVRFEPPGVESGVERGENLPALWVLAIGINQYEAASIRNLRYAVQDARAILGVFEQQAGKLYSHVYSVLVSDDAPLKPTKENILSSLAYLKQADARDVIVLFISGHGVSDKEGNYHLLPAEIRTGGDDEVPLGDAVPNQAINEVLNLPGKKLIFIDSCHSGGIQGKNVRRVDNNRLIKELQDFSTVIFASSKTDEYSIESPIYGHGLFTHSIIRGMSGEAESKIIRGKVTMMGLAGYVSESVTALSDNKQHPIMYTPDGYDYFNIAIVPPAPPLSGIPAR
ncbi:MAG: caspase family protein [Spirochaetaceae bacterium]|jgi:WD40 repeat protein|nr:caspase family protein [Spirochaetaceae bacterium]